MIEETITEYLRRETWIVLGNFLYYPSCFRWNKISSVVGFAYNVSNHQCGLDSSQMSAGKRKMLKIDDHKEKFTSSKKLHWSGGVNDL